MDVDDRLALVVGAATLGTVGALAKVMLGRLALDMTAGLERRRWLALMKLALVLVDGLLDDGLIFKHIVIAFADGTAISVVHATTAGTAGNVRDALLLDVVGTVFVEGVTHFGGSSKISHSTLAART
jgi:hypothetical protein